MPKPKKAPVAQRKARRSPKPKVAGSSPAGRTKKRPATADNAGNVRAWKKKNAKRVRDYQREYMREYREKRKTKKS